MGSATRKIKRNQLSAMMDEAKIYQDAWNEHLQNLGLVRRFCAALKAFCVILFKIKGKKLGRY